jgi:hypothetical protein
MAAPSAVAAADDAIQNTVESLFRPFRFERWIVLGFLALLDQCAHIASSGCQIQWPSGDESENDQVRQAWRMVLGWLSDHPLWAAGLAALVLSFVMVVVVVVLWITCRGRFAYLDNVATGRAEIARPWTEHAGHAGSHFAWLLGTVVGVAMVLVSLTLPVAWAVFKMTRDGPGAGTIATLVASGLALLAVGLASSLFLVALRDFVAPLQWYGDLSCGDAVSLFRRLFRANKALFVVYVLLKIAFTFVAALLMLAVCCCCCCVLLPFFQQVALQPIFYFERRWSIEILKQLGHVPPGTIRTPADPVATPAVEAPTPPEPDPEPGIPF